MAEVIVPSKYILTDEEEICMFPGVAYTLDDGTVRNEILFPYEKFLSVQIASQIDDNVMFTVSHVFAERYINKCLNRTIDNVEIFRFFYERGDYKERPADMGGDLIVHFTDTKKKDTWATYEHISGPYLTDPQYIVSAFTSNRLDYISPFVTENLIPDRAHYMRHPQNLPIVGVVIDEDDASREAKFMEDLYLLSRTKKQIYLN